MTGKERCFDVPTYLLEVSHITSTYILASPIGTFLTSWQLDSLLKKCANWRRENVQEKRDGSHHKFKNRRPLSVK